jgi:hypothetical protein
MGGIWCDLILGPLSDDVLICIGVPLEAGPFVSEYEFCQIPVGKSEVRFLFRAIDELDSKQ